MPYGVPVSYAYKDSVIYMHCAAAEGLKIGDFWLTFPTMCDIIKLPKTAFAVFSAYGAVGLRRAAILLNHQIILLRKIAALRAAAPTALEFVI